MLPITEVRCSNLSRIMTCAGVLGFDNLPPETEGFPAKEGTAAGRYLQYLMEGVDEGNIPEVCDNGVIYDDDIKYYMKDLNENIKARRGNSPILCEQRVDWMTRSGIVVRGQYDAAYELDEKTLAIDDCKYGYLIVEPEENWQLLGYAIGEILRRGKAYERIVMRIMQPRPHHERGAFREWGISYHQLLEYKEKIEARMDQIAAGFRQLVTSQKCKYCPAAAYACTAFNKAFYHGIDYVLNDFVQDDLNEKAISYHLDLIARVSEVMKIRQDSLKDLAVSRLADGKIIPGYMTEKNFGDRKWRHGISPRVIETLTGINVIKQEMVSPAQAEKLGVNKEVVAAFVERHFIGQKLVRKDTTALGNAIFGNQQPTAKGENNASGSK